MHPCNTQLLLATTNPDKVREYRAIFAGLPLSLLTPSDLRLSLDVDETGATFRENADLKARAHWQASGLPCLAEDSGLEVEALRGAPGVHSARWQGDDYASKNRLLIQRLEGLVGAARRCRYVCEIAFVAPNGRLRHARGWIEGQIALEPAGSGGFGYDPIFYLPDLGLTAAQLDPDQKNALSHRGRAARRIRPVLQRVLVDDDGR
jgi:XTP/dITP diphosphohydrolase